MFSNTHQSQPTRAAAAPHWQRAAKIVRRLVLAMGPMMALTVVACGSDGSAAIDNGTGSATPTGSDGTGSATPTESAAVSFGNVANGETVYVQWCASCHGVDGRGTAAGTNLFQSVPYLSEAELADITINGIGTMPGFGNVLSDTEVDDVVAYQVATYQ